VTLHSISLIGLEK